MLIKPSCQLCKEIVFIGRCRTRQLKGQCCRGQCCRGQFTLEKFLFKFQEISSEGNLTRHEVHSIQPTISKDLKRGQMVRKFPAKKRKSGNCWVCEKVTIHWTKNFRIEVPGWESNGKKFPENSETLGIPLWAVVFFANFETTFFSVLVLLAAISAN